MTEDRLQLTDEEWRERLDPKAHAVLRKESTERAFSGELWDEKRSGRYDCGGCGAPLFGSDAKYESGTGWPSFFQPLEGAPVGTRKDRRLWMTRVEVHCDRCGGHLGHVFEDGPEPTGMRYCLNSAALCFESDEAQGEA